jgi:VWFA-related protein
MLTRTNYRFTFCIRLALAGVLCLPLYSQSKHLNELPPTIGSLKSTEQPPVIGTSRVTEIVVPVTVHDRDGNIVNGLQPRQFHLSDNGKEQDINVDVTYHPISLAIVVQANASVEAILPQVKKIGPLLETFIVGDQGEAAVLAFDHRFQLKQDFTSDSAQISEALKKINPGSSTSRVVDAIDEGVRMLNHRPANRRRVLLLISETRDYGSEGKMRTALLDAQLANVIVYTVNMSRMVATLTNKPYPGPDPLNGLPASAYPMPAGVPATPTTVMQKGMAPGTNADVVPLIVEIMRDVKSIFVDNPAEKMTKATGGYEFSFFKQKGLEEAVAKIGSELHSQYIITYNPNNKDDGGWHDIKVALNRPELKVRARPGYWLATVQ